MPPTEEHVVFRASVSGPAGRTTLVIERSYLCEVEGFLWQKAVERRLGAAVNAADRRSWDDEELKIAEDLAREVLHRSRTARGGPRERTAS